MARNGRGAHTQLLKTLGHPARLRILSALRSGEECVCHLTVALGQRQAYVSQQLIFLRQAGLITDRKDGQRVYYRVKDPQVYHLIDALERVVGQEIQSIKRGGVFKNCSCPKCEAKYTTSQ